MSFLKGSLLLTFILVIIVGVAFILAWLYAVELTSYADIKTALTTTTATFGTLLGIITAGLMFTQGKFSELSSELSEKSPDYLTTVLPLVKIQSIENHLLTLRKTFTQLAATTTITEERNLYERIVAKASSMFVDFATISNLKLRQQGLPDTSLLASEMDSSLYKTYEKERKSVKKEWQLFKIIRRIINTWEAPTSFLNEKSKSEWALKNDLKSCIAILKIKENIDKNLTDIRSEAEETFGNLSDEINEVSKRLHKDRIHQLLSQMEHASTIRGKYFYTAVIFITTPLLINLLILPFFAETTVAFFKPIVSITSSLSVMGVIFLLLYIHKILNV